MKKVTLSQASRKVIQEAYWSNSGVYVSLFTAWEVGMLASKGRVTLATPPDAWFDALIGMPGIRLAPLTPRILIESSIMPGTPPTDPADRIIAATARLMGHRLITRDRRLLAYAEQGHILAIEC